MNEMVKNSIDARKNALFTTYEVTSDKLKKEIDELFERIYDFGKDMKDQSEFETKFVSSPLNQEYIDIFTKVATSSPMVQEIKNQTNMASVAADMATDMVEMELESATMPARRAARQAAYDVARDLPVVGDVLYAKQNIDMVKSVTGAYKDKKEE